MRLFREASPWAWGLLPGGHDVRLLDAYPVSPKGQFPGCPGAISHLGAGTTL